MFDIIATEIGVDDIWECAILPYAPKGSASCCLTVIRNRKAKFKFCPSCGKKIEYRSVVQRVTPLGTSLGVTKDHVSNDLHKVLAPLVKEHALVVHGPVRTVAGMPPVYLVGLCPSWAEAPSRGLLSIDPDVMVTLKKKVAKTMEGVTGRRCEVRYYRHAP